MSYDDRVEFSILKGKTLIKVEIEVGEQSATMEDSDGQRYLMHHNQDCCESVSIEDVIGDIKDLIGNPILLAEEVTNADEPEGVEIKYRDDSETWTFYKLSTVKGSVTIRWYGSSNGYYSESVDFEKID